MEFSRTSDTSIKCVITKSEIARAGITLTDILEHKSSSMEFLHAVVDRAAKEVGYDDVNKLNTLQMAVIQDQIVIHISEGEIKPEDFKKDILEKIEQMSSSDKKEYINSHIREISSELKKMVDEMLDLKAGKDVYGDKYSNRKHVPLEEAEKKITEVPYMFSFEHINDLLKYLGSIDQTMEVNSKLLKNKNGGYILVLQNELGKTDAVLLGKAVLRASDYGVELSQSANYLAHLEETMECMIADHAIEKVSIFLSR